MSSEAMGKVVQIDSESHPASRAWVVIYRIIFGESISVPEPGQLLLPFHPQLHFRYSD